MFKKLKFTIVSKMQQCYSKFIKQVYFSQSQVGLKNLCVLKIFNPSWYLEKYTCCINLLYDWWILLTIVNISYLQNFKASLSFVSFLICNLSYNFSLLKTIVKIINKAWKKFSFLCLFLLWGKKTTLNQLKTLRRVAKSFAIFFANNVQLFTTPL